ncbi:MAG: hypothetical protein FGM54_09625, partial [Chitinophagaceae bacterium]|nr:hypothetical protein [Chitinophagaceae bacterium]
LYAALGTPEQPNTNGAVLFLEDLDEYLYHIDRMITALKRAGLLKNLAALVVGGMTDMRDNSTPFGFSAEEIIFNARFLPMFRQSDNKKTTLLEINKLNHIERL